MRFSLAFGVMVACGLAFASPVPKEKDRAKDDDMIQDTWSMEKFEGLKGPPPAVSAVRFTFKDGKVTVAMVGKPETKPATYKLDPSAKPKALDMTGPGGVPALGIYELDGDMLRICLAEGPGATRPTEFKAEANGVSLITLKRLKDQKKDK